MIYVSIDGLRSTRASFIFVLGIPALLTSSCIDHGVNPPEKQLFTTTLKGNVILENQTEHSNALVYLDSLNRGVSTDSSGYYALQFADTDRVYSGTFTIRYFVNEFEMDSAQYVLINGKAKLDSMDVDADGNLPTKRLKQILRIEGWTDKQEYRIGDTIGFTARFTNVSDRTLHVFIHSAFNQLGPVGLYTENYPAFPLSPCDPVTADMDIWIYVAGSYEGHVIYTIRDGNYCGDFIPLPAGEYVVTADLFIEGRFRGPYDKFEMFVFEQWYKLHRGKTPKFDFVPNKYGYPHVRVIQ